MTHSNQGFINSALAQACLLPAMTQAWIDAQVRQGQGNGALLLENMVQWLSAWIMEPDLLDLNPGTKTY